MRHFCRSLGLAARSTSPSTIAPRSCTASVCHFTFAGVHPVPFLVWKVDGDQRVQLQAFFVERLTTDTEGNALPLQSTTHNSTRAPSADPAGGYEWIGILDISEALGPFGT